MKILVINAGSSSLKYQIIDMDNEQMLCKETVRESDSRWAFSATRRLTVTR